MLFKIHSIVFLCLCFGYISNIRAMKTTKRTILRVNNVDISKKYAESEPGFDLTEEDMKKFNIWPDGVIPYYIDQVSYDKVLRDRIRSYLDSVNGVTGLTFSEMLSPPTNDSTTRWVFFINRKGLLPCKDHYMKDFTGSGVQKVVIGYDCMSNPGDVGQTILALAGVPPQSNAPNRDNYIEVEKANILPDKTDLFEKLGDQDWLFHDVDYDFFSAGHFSFHEYTANGAATIKPVGPYPEGVGETKDFSEADIWKIHMLYNYITAKKKVSEVDECDKLFEPGTAIAVTDAPVKDVIMPRKKPNKYLGLHDDEEAPNADNADANKKDSGEALKLDGDADDKAESEVEEGHYDTDAEAAADEVVSDDKK